MSSREFIQHTTVNAAPATAQVGDEYFNTTTNKLYKNLIVSGTTVSYNEIPILSQPVVITNSTSAISTSTGALTVAGGVGITGNLYVGGSIVGNVPGGWVYLSTVTVSGATTADIETTFSSTYDNYVIVASGFYFPSGGLIYVNLKIAGSYQSAGYYHAGMYNTTSATGFGASNAAQIALGQLNVHTQAAYTANLVMYVYNAPSTSIYKSISYTGQYWNTATAFYNINGAGSYVNDTSALTGVRFYSSGGGTMVGTFRLYGIKNS
jgi:hypothetical protein